MKTKGRGLLATLKATFRSWSEDKAARLAAALAYYTIFSIAPLLVLVIAIAGFVIGSNAAIQEQVMAEVQRLVGQPGAEMVSTLISSTGQAREGWIASALGVIALVLGATGVFNQLKDALNTIWEVTPKPGGLRGLLRQRLAGLVMVLVLGFFLLVSLMISTALSVLNQYFTQLLGEAGPLALALNYAVQALVITVLFAAIFKWVPDVAIGWRDVWGGALFTAVLFLVGQFLISLYLTRASPSSAFGAAGSLVVLLLWIYYSAQILFLGAEFTKTLAHNRGAAIAPMPHARPVSLEERRQQGLADRPAPAATWQAPATGTGMLTAPAEAEPPKRAPEANPPSQAGSE